MLGYSLAYSLAYSLVYWCLIFAGSEILTVQQASKGKFQSFYLCYKLPSVGINNFLLCIYNSQKCMYVSFLLPLASQELLQSGEAVRRSEAPYNEGGELLDLAHQPKRVHLGNGSAAGEGLVM